MHVGVHVCAQIYASNSKLYKPLWLVVIPFAFSTHFSISIYFFFHSVLLLIYDAWRGLSIVWGWMAKEKKLRAKDCIYVLSMCAHTDICIRVYRYVCILAFHLRYYTPYRAPNFTPSTAVNLLGLPAGKGGKFAERKKENLILVSATPAVCVLKLLLVSDSCVYYVYTPAVQFIC